MTATWSFVPQGIFRESLQTDVTQVQVSPVKDWVVAVTNDALRQFELNYLVVQSQTAREMAQFFKDRQGAWDPFFFRNPNDDTDYLVRFDSDLRIEHFAPAFFRTNPLAFTVVRTLSRIEPASLYIIESQVRSMLGTFQQSLFPGSATALTFQSPLTDGGWIRVLAATSGPATAPYSFTVTYQDANSVNHWSARRDTKVSTNAMLEYELLGTYGRVTITMASSAAWVEGAVYYVPIRWTP